MPVEVRKKDKETTGALLRRFARKVQQSGVLLNAKKGRFFKKGKTRRIRRMEAIRRVKLKSLKRRLIREGDVKEDELISTEVIKKYLDKQK